MLTDLTRAVRLTFLSMVLFGGIYHLALWGVGQALFPGRAEGSLIRNADGTAVGSRLIAQGFTGPAYFEPRPSAVGYDAAAAGGSNKGPSNPDLLRAVRARLGAVESREGAAAGQVPSEMVTASGSGLDPDIPPEAAELQAARVARARGLPVEQVAEVIRAHVAPPTFGFLGRARVNVLQLNLDLDARFGAEIRSRGSGIRDGRARSTPWKGGRLPSPTASSADHFPAPRPVTPAR